jgi:hypothetical protein
MQRLEKRGGEYDADEAEVLEPKNSARIRTALALSGRLVDSWGVQESSSESR